MRRWGFAAALLFLVLTNVVLGARWAYNRGEPTGTLVLTWREVQWREVRLSGKGWDMLYEPARGEPMGRLTSVRLRWNQDFTPWLDKAKLESLGFDLSLPAVVKRKSQYSNYYESLQPRKAYVVLEYDGEGYAAWRRHQTERIATIEEKYQKGKMTPEEVKHLENEKKLLDPSSKQSHLFAIDAGADPAALRRQYPDRQRFIILAAEVRAICAATWDGIKKKFGPTRGRGSIRRLLVDPISISSLQRDRLEEFIRRPIPIVIIQPRTPKLLSMRRGDQLEGGIPHPIPTVIPPPPPTRLPEKRQSVNLTICSGRSYEPWVADVRMVEEAK